MNQTVIILDFGGQYKELIARRVRELGVYSVILPGSTPAARIKEMAPIGLIFTGGPDSVYKEGAPDCEDEILRLGVPILGICYGMQLLAHKLGGRVAPCEKSEYGTLNAEFDAAFPLFFDVTDPQVLMSHTDRVVEMPKDFRCHAKTALCPVAAFANESAHIYGVQFHPEVENTHDGQKILRRFLYDVCGATGDYNMEDYLETQLRAVREQVGNKKVLLGLSGGVDSSVCAALLSRAIGKQLLCVYIDHGFMRKNETKEVSDVFSGMDLNFIPVDASERFLSAVAGVTEPEQKRKIIGLQFARAFEEEARRHADVSFLAQGTIYPDVVESGANQSAVIKSHHNVGGLPRDLGFEGVVEPLKGLFKDEVRALGRMLGLPESLVSRQPFPGPGLAIRVIGEITREKLDLLRDADWIVREEIRARGEKSDQYFAVLTDTRSVGVMGDGRTYEYTLAVRAVRTNDFMTCEPCRLSYDTLFAIASRIPNEVHGINRVVYDITGKPPATIEWE